MSGEGRNVIDLRARLEQVPMPADGPPAITFGWDEDSPVTFRDMATLDEFIAEACARRESEAAEKALAPIEGLLASFGHVRDEDHGDDDDWPCVRCEMDRAIAQGRADSVAQGREEGGK
jgi:hypothetical protein